MAIQELPPRSCYDLREADPSIPLLDVRTPEEFAAGHPEGALNVPTFLRGPQGMTPNPDFLAVARRLLPDPAARVILSCARGNRSRRACEQLAELGYQHPINMVGGFDGDRAHDGTLRTPGWRDAGLPVSRDPGERSWERLRQG